MLKSLIAALFAAGLATPVQAQSDYPSQPVRVIVPSSPGGGTDTVGRLIAEQLSEIMGQRFFVENHPGAGGLIGHELASQAEPDGYTLVVSPSTLTTSHLVNKDMPYQVREDFIPISQIVRMPNALMVSNELPVSSFDEFVEYAKQRPGELDYGSAGIGTAPHMHILLFLEMAGLEMEHVPYPGVSPTLTALAGNEVDATITNVISATPQIEAGTVRGLAVTSDERLEKLPDVPTFDEVGMPDYDTSQWFGILAPAATPQEIIDELESAVTKAVQSPRVRDHFLAQGAQPVGSTSEEFATLIDKEIAMWDELAKKAGVSPQ